MSNRRWFYFKLLLFLSRKLCKEWGKHEKALSDSLKLLSDFNCFFWMKNNRFSWMNEDLKRDARSFRCSRVVFHSVRYASLHYLTIYFQLDTKMTKNFIDFPKTRFSHYTSVEFSYWNRLIPGFFFFFFCKRKSFS